MTTCPHCHSREVPSGANYCPFCGTSMLLQEPKIIINSLFPTALHAHGGDERMAVVPAGWTATLLSANPDLATGFYISLNNEFVDEADLRYYAPALHFAASRMFRGCSGLGRVDLAGCRGSHAMNVDMMFADCHKLETIDASPLDTSMCVNFYGMFSWCKALRRLDLRSFDTSNMVTAGSMFNACHSLAHIDVSGWNTTFLADASFMFHQCHSLRQLDLSSWRTPDLAVATRMFFGCSALVSVDLSGVDFGGVNPNQSLDLFGDCRALRHVVARGCNPATVAFLKSQLATRPEVSLII